jgi:hypothetical protein
MLELAYKLTNNINCIVRTFQTCGISPFNSRKLLTVLRQNITQATSTPSLAPHPSTPKCGSQACRVEREAHVHLGSNVSCSQHSKGRIEKNLMFKEGL